MAVTREEVTLAYKWMLGRIPFPKEIELWLDVPSVTELRRHFLESDEFSQSVRNQLELAIAGSPRPHTLPQNLAASRIDWQTDAHTSARLLDHVAQTWNKLGNERPHWSVLSSDSFLPDRITTTAGDFYASGATDAQRIVSALARHGIQPEAICRVVEYGCGVGRVTPHLAKLFHSVTACDISESHLTLARELIQTNGFINVTFLLARPPDFGMAEPFDFWFSHIVLQHNSPPLIAMILRQAFARLASGGIAMFQLPTYAIGYQFNTNQYLAAPTEPGTIEVHCLPQAVVFQLADEAGCVPLEIREDGAMGPPSAWLSNTFIFRKQRH
jgi:SAM-dependent methyltransferase